MGDDDSERFDGMKIYEYMRATQAKYIIKGDKIHEYMRATQPKYIIKGDKIYEYMSAGQPIYQIKGNKIHEYMRATQAIYEIRKQNQAVDKNGELQSSGRRGRPASADTKRQPYKDEEMNRQKSVEALINKSKKDLEALKKDYQASLEHKAISEELKIDIKNIFENLRSCFDYIAHDVFEACVTGNQPGKLYFPIRQSKKEFDQAINKDFPRLQASNPDVYNILESVQPYQDDWLSKFNRLNNKNKHQDLEEQTRTESRHVKVSSPNGGGSVSWGPGVTFGSGVSVMGAPIDPNTQMPIPTNQVKTEVVIWVDFKFRDNGESVLPFIDKSINSVEDIFKRLGQHIQNG